MTGMILADLQKTFVTIDHDILLKNLRTIGFSNHTIGWFKLYLSNRLFRVNLEKMLFRSFQYYVWGITRVHSGTVTVSRIRE